MKKDENASISPKKIIIISLILVFLLGISVIAGNVKLNSVTIKFANNHTITVLTSKTKVSEILNENHIIIASDETVLPNIDEDITDAKTIKISNIIIEPTKVANIDENINDNIDKLAEQYENITEKIITVKEEIPFETITKDVSNGSSNSTNKVLQVGKNGLKEVTYKVKYQGDVEISREEISSKIIKEPQDKIVQIQTKTTSRSASSRTAGTSGTSGKYKITAYCSCAACCGKTNGITASGTKATANHTIAAPSTFAFGTKVLINGIEYTVEDRGGDIQGNRIDVYMNSHSEALTWGVKYLNVEVLN